MRSAMAARSASVFGRSSSVTTSVSGVALLAGAPSPKGSCGGPYRNSFERSALPTGVVGIGVLDVLCGGGAAPLAAALVDATPAPSGGWGVASRTGGASRARKGSFLVSFKVRVSDLDRLEYRIWTDRERFLDRSRPFVGPDLDRSSVLFWTDALASCGLDLDC